MPCGAKRGRVKRADTLTSTDCPGNGALKIKPGNIMVVSGRVRVAPHELSPDRSSIAVQVKLKVTALWLESNTRGVTDALVTVGAVRSLGPKRTTEGSGLWLNVMVVIHPRLSTQETEIN
jgi:hypothetical protein